MAQDVTVAGASFTDVPSVTLPKTGGGTASFTDVTDTTAAAADVASGKYFYTAAGVRTAGTSSGGGGGRDLIYTKSLGTFSNVNTSATDTGQVLTLNAATKWADYDVLIVVSEVETVVSGRHIATISLVQVYGSSNSDNKDTASAPAYKMNRRADSSGDTIDRVNSTSYGIYVNGMSISDGTLSMPVIARRNNTYTTTINGTYIAHVYGVKLLDLIGG